MKKKIDELEYVVQKTQKRAVTNDDISRQIHEAVSLFLTPSRNKPEEYTT